MRDSLRTNTRNENYMEKTQLVCMEEGKLI